MFGVGIFRVLLEKPWGYFIYIFIFWGRGVGGGRVVPPFDHSRQLKSGVPPWKTSQANTVSMLFTFPSGVCDVFIYRFK